MKEGKKKDDAVAAGDDVAASEEGDRPKLAEGFYEVDAVRKKRVRKGKIQYLIKWRDWPESANTWEPKANLRAVSDIIDAYEHRLKPAKNNTAKKGKRKSGVTQSQPKKKQKQQQASPSAATYDVPTVKIRIRKNPLPMAPLGGSNGLAPEEEEREAGKINGVARDGMVAPSLCVAVPTQSMENGFGTVPVQNEDVNVGDINGNPASQEVKKSVVFQEPPKADDVSQGQSGRCIGSRRRKSGSVKKFTISSDPCEPFVAHTGLTILNGGYDLNHENKVEAFMNTPVTITRIVKPITYSTSVINDACDVSITFTALRSDGKEVIVDNKFLKTNNPLLLINFYEEHLRYNPMQ